MTGMTGEPEPDDESGDPAEDPAAGRGGDPERTDELVGGDLDYDCAPWAEQSRVMLAGLLRGNGVPHAWQGTTLTVREADEETVDGLIDDVLAAARPAIDPDVERVVFEVGAWPVALQTSLAESLTVAAVAYEWDAAGDLVVAAEHEALVERILDELPDPDDPDLDADGQGADDGIAVHALLDRLFGAAGRLARHPTDATATVTTVDVVADLERIPAPFGFDAPQWRALLQPALALRDALEGVGEDGVAVASSDDDIRAHADEVRTRLRSYL
jgi:hypothetical protein